MLMGIFKLGGHIETLIASKQPMGAFVKVDGHFAHILGGCTVLISASDSII